MVHLKTHKLMLCFLQDMRTGSQGHLWTTPIGLRTVTPNITTGEAMSHLAMMVIQKV